MKKFLYICIILSSSTTYAQKKVSQEQIKREQEEAKKSKDLLQEFYKTDFSSEKFFKFSTEYQDELGVKYDIPITQFLEFQEFLDSRKAAQIPFLFKRFSLQWD